MFYFLRGLCLTIWPFRTIRDLMTLLWYAFAGGFATAMHYAVLLTFVEVFDLPAAPSAAAGALVGALMAYLINWYKTFAASAARHRQALPRFMLIAVAGAAVNGAMVWVGAENLHWHYLVAQSAATLSVLGLTYRLNRCWTFA